MTRRIGVLAGLILLLQTAVVQAQEDFGTRLGVRRGGEVVFEPYGPGILFDALDPAVKKWYVPQELYNEYQWRQWEYSNYARSPYEKYVSTNQEGSYFYDIYGSYITRGWLVFDWTVSEPQAAGNRLLKSSQFGGFFGRLVVASDSKGQYFASITVGDQIRTTLTPMTFAKPIFDGIQFDLATDKYEATIIASRPSGFRSAGNTPTEKSNVTNLLGGRFTAQIGDFVKVGATYVNSFNAQTRGQAFQGNPLRGALTEDQNADITEVQIRLSDDSPEDLAGGTAFFLEEVIITTIEGERISNRRRLTNKDGNESAILEYQPVIEGGFQREGFRTADGRETITLRYQLDGPEYKAAFGPPAADIEKLEFRLLVANDYRIDITSNNQTNQINQPVFLSEGMAERTIRAEGNVQDGSNQRFVVVDYGLPTANEIFGFTLDVNNVAGFDLQAEFDRNRQHSRYPRFGENDPTNNTHSTVSADAWMVNLSKQAYPLYLFGEAYSMDPEYSTRSYIASEIGDTGPVYYDSQTQAVYEFVDDNDDQDVSVDWQRRGQGAADLFVFPGWDENNDFIADFNQNHVDQTRPNLKPDWEEPFLRYNVDRPQFLFGVDMNNNGVVDRFENDDEPDFPYRRDRRGYNIYGGTFLGPYARVSLGRVDEWQLADDRSNTTNYLMLSYDQDFAQFGRLRIYENFRRAKDDIKDDLLIWRIADGIAGEIVPRDDPLPARDAWANTVYMQFDFKRFEKLTFTNKFKYEFFHQVDYDERQEAGNILPTEDVRETASFLGFINKLDYTYQIGQLVIQPRWKSEFQRFLPSLKVDQFQRPTTELRESFFLISRYPILPKTTVQAGVEYLFTQQYRDEVEETLQGSPRDELVGALQVTNRTAYQGYEVYTQFGLRVARIDIDVLDDSQTETFIFFTMYAGFGD
ncbi:MAG: hypothetical protein GKR89_21275 [Candidatus Latescibacteria bacterium]|nr:hypothetical protein [Candidatus Latescibacterota bacterium]